MGKIRINKLALELNIPNDKIIDALKKKDYPVKNHMSSIDGEAAALAAVLAVMGLATVDSFLTAAFLVAFFFLVLAVGFSVNRLRIYSTAKTAAKAAAKKKADLEKKALEKAKNNPIRYKTQSGDPGESR